MAPSATGQRPVPRKEICMLLCTDADENVAGGVYPTYTTQRQLCSKAVCVPCPWITSWQANPYFCPGITGCRLIWQTVSGPAFWLFLLSSTLVWWPSLCTHPKQQSTHTPLEEWPCRQRLSASQRGSLHNILGRWLCTRRPTSLPCLTTSVCQSYRRTSRRNGWNSRAYVFHHWWRKQGRG